ncbi:nuclear speckle splicing regulatory protein 1 [Vanessa cardui]|uniref:nuclear speckle splicing regulatory protein 1 n=1 Tax=Vanessa cardui TaxID=171605 RepID=UPI001F139C45|nr:nuclear speckle splicing regulatory protein 1 [Vanessa cardui]
MSNQNKYGLIVRDQKSKLNFEATRNVFGSDGDSDDDRGAKPVLLKPSANINRQSKVAQEKALTEDPTVYQYDEIYDSMSKEKLTKKKKTQDEKKPRYIENLLKTANKRKLENERRIERQIQKEREKEGDEFADKEVFVTSAYKKKLEELRQEEEKEKYEEFLESVGDVTKQGDLGGFYRHLYEQKLGSKKLDDSENNTKCDKNETQETVTEKTESKTSETVTKLQQGKQRNYRKRKVSNDVKLSEGEIEDSGDEIKFSNLDDIRTFKKSKALNENIDADSDFSIDESSDEEPSNKKEDIVAEVANIEKPKTKENDSNSPKEDVLPVEKKELEKPKVKIDIWKKRTVGEVFEEALRRYYERKASRGI